MLVLSLFMSKCHIVGNLGRGSFVINLIIFPVFLFCDCVELTRPKVKSCFSFSTQLSINSLRLYVCHRFVSLYCLHKK